MAPKVTLAILFSAAVALNVLYQTKNVPVVKTNSNDSVFVDNQKDCTAQLDALDAFFNARRLARHTTSYRPPTNVEAMDIFEPEAICLSEERFGGGKDGKVLPRHDAFGDGPKFACGIDVLAAKSKASSSGTNKHDGCLVYNVGSKNEIDFEVAVQTFVGCEIHTFDPTLSVPYIGGNYSSFHPWGIGIDGQTSKYKHWEWTSKGIETIYEELGHKKEQRKIDILKIDCEGCEWLAMPPVFDAMARGELKIDQIQIEVHIYSKDPPAFEKVRSFFQGVDKAGLRVTHKERNHWGCAGWRCLEYVLVHEDFLREANGAAMGC